VVKVAFVKEYDCKSSSSNERKSDFYGSGLLALCKPVDVLVHPKPPSRVWFVSWAMFFITF